MYNIIESLTFIVAGLKAAIAYHRDTPKPRIAFLERVWHRLHGMRNRFERLFIRWQNGTLTRPRPPRPARAPDPAEIEGASAPAPRPARPRLPRGRAWLIRDTQAAAAYRGQLAHLLATHPDMPAFLEAAPQAGRILRPLCRMLGIDLARPHGIEIPHLAAIASPPPPRPRPIAPRPIAASPIAARPIASCPAAPRRQPPPASPRCAAQAAAPRSRHR